MQTHMCVLTGHLYQVTPPWVPGMGDASDHLPVTLHEGIELSLKFEGDGEYEGIVGGRVMVPGSEESEGLVTERVKTVRLICGSRSDLRSDGGCAGHSVVGKEGMECFMREWKAEVGWKLVVVWC